MITIKRAYVKPDKKDGYRILVDRLWPRGVSKESAQIAEWIKDIAPSNELRKWFNHDPQKWYSFAQKYKVELQSKGEFLQYIKNAEKKHRTITLIYGAKDTDHNQAIVLLEVLKDYTNDSPHGK